MVQALPTICGPVAESVSCQQWLASVQIAGFQRATAHIANVKGAAPTTIQDRAGLLAHGLWQSACQSASRIRCKNIINSSWTDNSAKHATSITSPRQITRRTWSPRPFSHMPLVKTCTTFMSPRPFSHRYPGGMSQSPFSHRHRQRQLAKEVASPRPFSHQEVASPRPFSHRHRQRQLAKEVACAHHQG